MGWTLDKYAGQIRMPSDIFKPLPNSEVAMEVSMSYVHTPGKERVEVRDLLGTASTDFPTFFLSFCLQIRKKAYISTEAIEQIGAVGKPVDAPRVRSPYASPVTCDQVR